jgi:hypothetical protein
MAGKPPMVRFRTPCGLSATMSCRRVVVAAVVVVTAFARVMARFVPF